MECLQLDGEKGQEVSATLMVQTWLRRAEATTNVHPLLLVPNKLLIREPAPQLNFEPSASTHPPKTSPPRISDPLMILGQPATLCRYSPVLEETIESDGIVEEVIGVHADQSSPLFWDSEGQLAAPLPSPPSIRAITTLTDWAPAKRRPVPPRRHLSEVFDSIFDVLWVRLVPVVCESLLIPLYLGQIDVQATPAQSKTPPPVIFGDMLAVSRKHLITRHPRSRLAKPSPSRQLLKKNMSNYSSELTSETVTPIHMQGHSRTDSRSESPQFLMASFEVAHLASNSIGFKTDRMKSAVGRGHSLHSKRPSIGVRQTPKLPPITKPQANKKPSKTPDRKPRGRYFPDASFSRNTVKCEIFRKTRQDSANFYRNNRSSPLRIDPTAKAPSPQRVISLHYKARKV